MDMVAVAASSCQDSHTRTVLDFFAEELTGWTQGLPARSDPDEETIRRIDDWWFAPRTELPAYSLERQRAEERLEVSLLRYQTTGTLPTYFEAAYAYAQALKELGACDLADGNALLAYARRSRPQK